MPVFAEPGVTVPDDGTRPLGEDAGDTQATSPETVDGPLSEQIDQATIEVAQLAEETTAAEAEWTGRSDRLRAATEDWNASRVALEEAQTALDYAAGQAYADTAGVPETELPDLTGLTPLGGEWDLPGLTEAVDDAETAEAVAHASYDAAAESASRSEERYTALNDEFTRADDELQRLIENNSEELEELEEAREEAAAEYSDDFSSEVDGWEAAPEATKAVEYALAQLGKPYEWSEEGPDTFDCSGLTMAAYDYAGVSIPRTAAMQFNATRDKPVDTEMLLPGDLLFWWNSPGDWESVYHVGMYLGDGKMVQAPRTGDVVKISSIWFDNFAGAHRVVDAIPTGDGSEEPSGDGTTAEPDPSPSDGHTLEPDPSPTPSPSPSPSPSPTPDEPTPTPEEPSPSDDASSPTEEESPDSPTPSTSDSVSGTLSRDPEAGETSGELSEGGYGVRRGDGTMVPKPAAMTTLHPRGGSRGRQQL